MARGDEAAPCWISDVGVRSTPKAGGAVQQHASAFYVAGGGRVEAFPKDGSPSTPLYLGTPSPGLLAVAGDHVFVGFDDYPAPVSRLCKP